MDLASKLALAGGGLFFLAGLLTGVWKYLAISRSAQSQAPRYVSVAHQASLLYSFATLIFLQLLEFSPYPEAINVVAVAVPLFFFAAAVGTYVAHAILRDTDNQFATPYRMGRRLIPARLFRLGVWLLIIGEVGGFAVLFVGALTVLIQQK